MSIADLTAILQELQFAPEEIVSVLASLPDTSVPRKRGSRGRGRGRGSRAPRGLSVVPEAAPRRAPSPNNPPEPISAPQPTKLEPAQELPYSWWNKPKLNIKHGGS